MSLPPTSCDTGSLFVIIAAVAAGALVPELFLIVFFQSGRPARLNLRNLIVHRPDLGDRRFARRSPLPGRGGLVW